MKRGIRTAVVLSTLALIRPDSARAVGVVGNGTAASCTDGALDAALAGGGSVSFDCGPGAVTIDISPSAGGSGTKTISDDTTLDGGGLVTLSGGHEVGVFSVPRGVAFTMRNVSIVNGKAAGGPGGGGAISNSGGIVIVSNCTFTNNSSGRGGWGGAIMTETDIPLHDSTSPGPLTVSNSTFTGNSAPEGLGGAISSRGSATLLVSGSTFSDNRAYRGGGIFFSDDSLYGGATLAVSNSTFTGNTADGDRGGGLLIYPRARGPLTVSNCTFTGNSAVLSGGGIQKGCDAQGCADTSGSALVVINTIVASNAGGNCGLDTASSLSDGGHNLDDGTTCGFSAANGSSNDTDPQLDPTGLADNGGPTQTIALQATSPAIDAGNQAACAAAPVNGVDQRGATRPGADATSCSIGAYEYTGATQVCMGDCSGDQRVTVGELVTLVNMALGSADAAACAAGLSLDTRNPTAAIAIRIPELVRAVSNALNGCPAD